MKISFFQISNIICLFSCLLASACVSNYEDARNYYLPVIYDDLSNGIIKPSNHKLVKQDGLRQELQAIEEIKKKAEWTLYDCVKLAIANEERLKIQGEAYYQTKWLFYQALASWLPSVSLESGSTRYNSSSSNAFSRNRDEYWLKVRQPIFNSGREIIALSNSKELNALQKYELKQARDVLILTVASTFYRILELKNELSALDILLEYTKRHLDMVMARVEVQLASRKDALLAEAALYNIKARIAQTNNLLNSARIDLQLLVGAPLPQNFVDTTPLTAIPENIDEAISIALNNRPDVKIAEQQIRIAQAEVNLARANYLPQVNIDWSRYLHSESIFLTGIDWMLYLSISLPFDNGAKYAKLEEASSKLRQAILDKERILKSVRNDVEKAYRDLQAIKSDIEFREKELAAAKETADIVSGEYKVGAATNVEVLFTKNSFEQARIALDKAKLDLKLAYLRLKFAMGLLPKEF